MASRIKSNVATVSLECMLPGGFRWTQVPVESSVAGILYGTQGSSGIYVLPQAVEPGKNLVLMLSPSLTRLVPGEEVGIVSPLEEQKRKPKRTELDADSEEE